MVNSKDLSIWRMLWFSFVVGSATLMTEFAYSESKLFLVCRVSIDPVYAYKDEFSLSLDTGDVLYRTSHHTRRGELIVEELEYRFIFQSTDELWAQEWRVSRLTGEFIRETGNAPAFEFSADNTTERGNCELLSGYKF